MKMLSAHTAELDDKDRAVQDLLGQLDLGSLQKNSLGILHCHYEFIHEGIVKAVCDALPFDVIGCTTLATGVPGKCDVMLLTLTVLTADDTAFSTRLTHPLDQPPDAATTAELRQAVDALPGKDRMLLAYLPFLKQLGGEVMMNRILDVTGDIPFFGTLGCDDTPAMAETLVIYNGEAHAHHGVVSVITGSFSPAFFMLGISEEHCQKQRAVITSAEGNVMKTVNGMPAVEYLNSIGLSVEEEAGSKVGIPLVVNYGDGTPPVARGMYMDTPEGHLVCGATMPQNGTLAIGNMSADYVLESAGELTRQVLASGKTGGILLYPCITRNLVLGVDTLVEMQQLGNAFEGRLPYQVAYSGGEFCPLPGEGGKLQNRFHNFSLVACAF